VFFAGTRSWAFLPNGAAVSLDVHPRPLASKMMPALTGPRRNSVERKAREELAKALSQVNCFLERGAYGPLFLFANILGSSSNNTTARRRHNLRTCFFPAWGCEFTSQRWAIPDESPPPRDRKMRQTGKKKVQFNIPACGVVQSRQLHPFPEPGGACGIGPRHAPIARFLKPQTVFRFPAWRAAVNSRKQQTVEPTRIGRRKNAPTL